MVNPRVRPTLSKKWAFERFDEWIHVCREVLDDEMIRDVDRKVMKDIEAKRDAPKIDSPSREQLCIGSQEGNQQQDAT